MTRKGPMLCLIWLVTFATSAGAAPNTIRETLVEPPVFERNVAEKSLPPIEKRVPSEPWVVDLEEADGLTPGRYGGTLDMLIGREKDVRLLVVYGYARLVGYAPDFSIVPDIARAVDVEEGRRFTFHLREGHRWSDGAPFTSEDFRYYWEDVATDPAMSRFGLPSELLVAGEPPTVAFPDALTVRYEWSNPNPTFLAALASTQPLEIFKPAHYLKRFHARYAEPEELGTLVEAEGKKDWVSLHVSMDRAYRNDNAELPTLQPWMLKSETASQRYVFARNPFYHRIDGNGRQLPYIDRVVLTVTNPSLIPAKVAGGEADLQAAYLSFSNYTVLKQAEERGGYELRRWRTAKGSRMTLFPNLNARDPIWRDLLRDVRFRRALSLAINREDINNAIFYGLARPAANTVLDGSPLFDADLASRWAEFDPDEADWLLDDMGLVERDRDGTRLLPDGRPMMIVVETAGEEDEQTDILELIRDDWRGIGVELFIKPSQRDVFRNRIKAGSTLMGVWTGLENGLPSADMSPAELAPTRGDQLQWPAWGLHTESRGQAGEPVEDEAARRLVDLSQAWPNAAGAAERERIWREMLKIWAEQVFTIGVVTDVDQLVAVSTRLRNVPERGVYNYDPGAFLGLYRPDTFWFDDKPSLASVEGGER